ncbi:TPA: glycosyltransferase family 4 protein [Streptococcus suis]
MKKVLIISTVSRQFYLFEQANIRVLRNLGYEVHGAANFDDRSARLKEVNIIEHNIPFQRSPFTIANFKAYKELLNLVENQKFDIIHCHSPVGGVLGRLVGMRVQNTKVFYTAHGFHFYKGSPLLNWLLFYPIEKYLSKYTDQMIVINNEDFTLAKNKFKMKNLNLVTGIGVNFKKFAPSTFQKKMEMRKSLSLKESDHVLIYVGELSKRKNQMVLIETMVEVLKKFPNSYLLLVGQGELKSEYLEKISKLKLTDHIHLLGYRNDIADLMQMSDVALSSSIQEGLPVNLMEAMGVGLPLIVSNCRGNSDLVENQVNGIIVAENKEEFWAKAICELLDSPQLLKLFGQRSFEKSIKYSEEEVMRDMYEIYNKHI